MQWRNRAEPPWEQGCWSSGVLSFAHIWTPQRCFAQPKWTADGRVAASTWEGFFSMRDHYAEISWWDYMGFRSCCDVGDGGTQGLPGLKPKLKAYCWWRLKGLDCKSFGVAATPRNVLWAHFHTGSPSCCRLQLSVQRTLSLWFVFRRGGTGSSVPMSQSSLRSNTKFALNRKVTPLQLFSNAFTVSNINFNGFQMNHWTKAEGSRVHDIIFLKCMISFFRNMQSASGSHIESMCPRLSTFTAWTWWWMYMWTSGCRAEEHFSLPA